MKPRKGEIWLLRLDYDPRDARRADNYSPPDHGVLRGCPVTVEEEGSEATWFKVSNIPAGKVFVHVSVFAEKFNG